MRNPKLRQIDTNGNPISEWVLWNAYFSGVDFGSVSYDEDSIVNYTLTISYDYASLNGTTPGSKLRRDG